MPDATTAESITAPQRGGDTVRWHELALQRWLHNHFLVADGYPIPVIFAAPQDAFSQFKNLWKADNNPFLYLTELKGPDGKQIYRPHPEPPKYPLLSVQRKGWGYRASQNYSTHRWRRITWPTVNGDVKKRDLANVATSRMPSAWNYKFQVDLFCLHPETMSIFVGDLMHSFWRSGGQPQTWITVAYPGHFDKKYVRMAMDGDIDYVTPPDAEEGKIVEQRCSFSVTIEGYNVDLDYQILPTLWTSVLRGTIPSTPEVLQTLFEVSTDLRDTDASGNPILDSRPNVPPVE